MSVPRAWRGKRLFDLAVSMVLLLLSVPVFLVVAAAVALTSPGPVFFRQRRVGFAGTEFEILKFRTMHVGAEEVLAEDAELLRHYLDGDHKIPCHLDPRVTAVGRFLRLSSLDELPQLVNVMRGEMSLIGPRPVRPDELPEYRQVPFAYLAVRPGLTGLWQVSGRSQIAFPLRAEIDAEYYRRCSLLTDVAILARTAVAVLACRGAG
ncbi:MAG: sugar transferase [Actinomycetota bacterium]|nr:sugar transferase [Actinomycetota bacterium]